jgi:hypothetical protein
MTDDRTADDTQNQEEEPPPELADWWVWGVRRVAAVIADFLHSVRFIPLVFILFKGAMWAFTRDPNELLGAGAGVAGFFALWGGGCCWGDSRRSGTHRIPSSGYCVNAVQSASDASPARGVSTAPIAGFVPSSGFWCGRIGQDRRHRLPCHGWHSRREAHLPGRATDDEGHAVGKGVGGGLVQRLHERLLH